MAKAAVVFVAFLAIFLTKVDEGQAFNWDALREMLGNYNTSFYVTFTIIHENTKQIMIRNFKDHLWLLRLLSNTKALIKTNQHSLPCLYKFTRNNRLITYKLIQNNKTLSGALSRWSSRNRQL